MLKSIFDMLKNKFYKKEEDYIKYEFEDYLKNIEDKDIKIYIETRLISHINWYDKKSIYNQKVYTRLTRSSIIMGASIPVLTIFNEFHWSINVVISIFGATVTIISSIIALSNYKELWNRYRKNCEILKSCLYLYFTRQERYKELTEEEAFCELVTVCEEKFAEELNYWSLLNLNKNKCSNKKES